MKWCLRWCVLLVVAGACSPELHYRKQLKEVEAKFKDHIGFMLYDPSSKETLIEYNSSKYFTPASNTKIVTFYAALKIIGDSIPALRFTIKSDSLIFWGTGDPSFLYSNVFQNQKVYDFLEQAPQHLYFSPTNFSTEHFGPGWAWDDYYFSYSSERTSFPVYGNLTEITETLNHQWKVKPLRSISDLIIGDSIQGETQLIREINSNHVTVSPGRKMSNNHMWQLPFHSTPEVFVKIISDTLKKPIELIRYPLPKVSSSLYSVPSDSLYRVMIQDSDNFIAEQMLLLCAGVISDTLKPEIAIQFTQKKYLFDLPDELVWVDGSGLSRYNLFTPRSMVRVWEKIYQEVPRERLFKLLATGGQSGTLKNWYKAESPFIFGKTGSVSNNHTLSGYLQTKKGKILIFSFMNANFIASSSDVRKMMQEFLSTIRDNY